jgi:Glycosyl transferase family 2
MDVDSPDGNPVHAALIDVEKSFANAGPVELSIVMPCLDEAETLGVCIDKAKSFLWRTGINGEVVIADNGSTDGSQAIARKRGARVVPVESRGYGAALIAGIQAARGRFVVMGDSDNSYDFANLDLFVEKLRAGYDVVMGNRFRGGIAASAMPKLHRYLGNPVLSFVGRLFFRSPIGDFHCGLRGFSREAVLALDLDAPGMEFASEMIVKATIAELRIAEVPTTLQQDGRSRPPHLRSWRDGWRHLKLLLEFAPHWLFLYPGGALASMGALIAAALVAGPLDLGPVTLDAATLLMAVAAILVGTQLVLFYAVAKTAAVTAGRLPETPRFEAMSQLFTVDRFCLAGGGLFALGFLVAAVSSLHWMVTGFGDLDPDVNIRLAALATLAMALGVQSATAGFLIGLVRQKKRPAETGEPKGETNRMPNQESGRTPEQKSEKKTDEAA